jgi:hypothetical protein
MRRRSSATPDGSSLLSQSPRALRFESNDPVERLWVEAFLVFLRDRRALHAPGQLLRQFDTSISVRKIISECEAYANTFDEAAGGAIPINKIARACSYFLELGEFENDAEFYLALGALRAILAEPIATLSAMYRVDAAAAFWSAVSPASNRKRQINTPR